MLNNTKINGVTVVESYNVISTRSSRKLAVVSINKEAAAAQHLMFNRFHAVHEQVVVILSFLSFFLAGV